MSSFFNIIPGAASRQRILSLKDAIVAGFNAENWMELGLVTGCESIVNGHDRLLRSLDWGDKDYGGHVLAVLMSMVERDPANLNLIADYVGRLDPGTGVSVSTAATKNRNIVFSPSVFDVPDEGVNSKLVAVMMPFSSDFEPVFAAIKQACDWNHLECLRVKDIWQASTIIQDVFSLIFRSQIVVCDFSTRNPNVFYEAGIAHTLGKHVVPLSQSQSDVPFDVSHHRYLPYLNNREGLAALTDSLQRRLYTLAGEDQFRGLSS